MTTIRTVVRVGPDGTVTIPVGEAEGGREVEVIVGPARQPDTINGLPREEWWALFERTEGSIDDPTFQRPSQTYFEPRRVVD